MSSTDDEHQTDAIELDQPQPTSEKPKSAWRFVGATLFFLLGALSLLVVYMGAMAASALKSKGQYEIYHKALPGLFTLAISGISWLSAARSFWLATLSIGMGRCHHWTGANHHPHHDRRPLPPHSLASIVRL